MIKENAQSNKKRSSQLILPIRSI